MLRLFLFVVSASALCLPDIYLKTLSNFITQEVAQKVDQEIEAHLNSLLLADNNTENVVFKKFYSIVVEHQLELKKPLKSRCGDNGECLRLCELLVDALEVRFHEKQLPDNSSIEPSRIASGVLHHNQNLRGLVWSRLSTPSFNETVYFKQIFDTNLLYLKLQDSIEGGRYTKVLLILEQRQAGFLSVYVQKSIDYYLNWLSRESNFIYPPTLTFKIFNYPDALVWYQKTSNRKLPHVLTMYNFCELLIQYVYDRIKKYEANPATFDADKQFSLVVDLLYLHQRYLPLSVFTGPEKRLFALEIELLLTSLYKMLEKLLLLTLNTLMKLTTLQHLIEFKSPQTLLMDKGSYIIHKVEVYYVDFARTRSVTSNMAKNGALKLYISEICPSMITADAVQKIIGQALFTNKTFTSELFNEFVQYMLWNSRN